MSRLRRRVETLAARIKPSVQGRGFWLVFDPKATDLSYDDFVAAEEERLGVTADDRVVIWYVVDASSVDLSTGDAHSGGGG